MSRLDDDTHFIEAVGPITPLDPAYPVAEIFDDGKRKRLLMQKWPRFLRMVGREMRSHVHIIGHYDRPGVLLFSNQLETRYFWPPGTALNDRFRLHRALWEDQEWLIMSFPKRVERFGPKTAERLGLKVADGFPTIIDIRPDIFLKARSKRDLIRGGDVVKAFPLNGDNVHTIEYPPGSPLASFATNPVGWRLLRAAELKTMRQTGDLMERQKDRN